MKLVLHGYFRSGTTYRVRLALNWKGVAYEYVPVNLAAGAQNGADYLARNPQGLVPALEAGDDVLTQSPAILEWIEETFPQRPLLPADPLVRARIRAFAAVIGCDIHPIQNLRILKAVGGEDGPGSQDSRAWARRWIESGFGALERLAEAAPGQNGFLFTDGPTLAEIYLVPQMFNATRFGVDVSAFPRLVAADAAARALPELDRAAPENQPDAV
jgi:maleylpyruvate isomerase